jgi:hypothetical protein
MTKLTAEEADLQELWDRSSLAARQKFAQDNLLKIVRLANRHRVAAAVGRALER